MEDVDSYRELMLVLTLAAFNKNEDVKNDTKNNNIQYILLTLNLIWSSARAASCLSIVNYEKG